MIYWVYGDDKLYCTIYLCTCTRPNIRPNAKKKTTTKNTHTKYKNKNNAHKT